MIVYSEMHMDRNVWWADNESFDCRLCDEEGIEEEEDLDEDYTSALYTLLCVYCFRNWQAV